MADKYSIEVTHIYAENNKIWASNDFYCNIKPENICGQILEATAQI
jgi:hypothetical protein